MRRAIRRLYCEPKSITTIASRCGAAVSAAVGLWPAFSSAISRYVPTSTSPEVAMRRLSAGL